MVCIEIKISLISILTSFIIPTIVFISALFTNNNKLYEFYCGVIPKNKTFFKYIKAKKKDYNPKVIEKLANYFQISTREIKDIYPSLTKQDINKIFQSIGLLDKEIKQLLK